jgi:hypothetical protein
MSKLQGKRNRPLEGTDRSTARHVISIAKRTGISEKVVAKFLHGMNAKKNALAEDGTPIGRVSLVDGVRLGYKLALDQRTSERLYNEVRKAGLSDSEYETPPSAKLKYGNYGDDPGRRAKRRKKKLSTKYTSDSCEGKEEMVDPENFTGGGIVSYKDKDFKKSKKKWPKAQTEGYNFKNVGKVDVVRCLTNFGFKERKAKNLMRRLGAEGLLEYLQSNLTEKEGVVKRQWETAIKMLEYMVKKKQRETELQAALDASMKERLSESAAEMYSRLFGGK